jgi:predicted nucleotidyltransferase
MANISQKWLNLNEKELEILATFTNGYSLQIHESEIVKTLKLPQRTVSRKLNTLANEGFLKYTRVGRNKTYFLNKDSPFLSQLLIFIESYKSTKFLLNNPKLAFLLKNLSCGVIIFGSYSKNHSNSESDIDIVFLCNKNKEIENIIKNSPIEIHPQFSSLKNLKEKLNAKDALALEIVKNHVILTDFDILTKIFMESLDG